MVQVVIRRRSPGWVRAMTSRELHGIAGRFAREWPTADISASQHWLWDAVLSELEYRARRARPAWTRCTCEFCFAPFPE